MREMEFISTVNQTLNLETGANI